MLKMLRAPLMALTLVAMLMPAPAHAESTARETENPTPLDPKRQVHCPGETRRSAPVKTAVCPIKADPFK